MPSIYVFFIYMEILLNLHLLVHKNLSRVTFFIAFKTSFKMAAKSYIALRRLIGI